MDPQLSLDQVNHRAARKGINLKEEVVRERFSGRGGCATVYRGKLSPSGTLVAIKTATGGVPDDEKIIKKVLREAHVWSKLDHENVLPLLGITTAFDYTVSMVSLWMEAGNAIDYVQNKDIDPRPLIVGVARGLCYLHEHPKGPIIHSDLKGANVLISNSGHALITDFGFTYLASSSFSLGVSSCIGGTYNWMPPEALEMTGPSIMTVESDVWSFAMTALELFTRKIPFDKCKTPLGVSFRILAGPPDYPTDELTCHRMTGDWWNIFLECWKKDPPSRPSIREILSKVEGITGMHDIKVLPPPNPMPKQCWKEDPLLQPSISQTLSKLEGCKLEAAVPEQNELAKDDVIIAVMGPVGSGKSSFIAKATGTSYEGGDTLLLGSYTKEVKATKCSIGPFSNVVLVDTPGFDTAKSDMAVLNMTSSWLHKTYKRKTVLSAILYFHPITDNCTSATALPKSSRAFQKLCGNAGVSQVVLTTTMWDEVDEEIGEERLVELQSMYWKEMIAQGSRTMRYRNTSESAMQVLQEVIAMSTKQRYDILQREVQNLKQKLPETRTGQELHARLDGVISKQFQLLSKVHAEKSQGAHQVTVS